MYCATLVGILFVSACASTPEEIPIATAWTKIDLSEVNLNKATNRLRNALLGAAKDMNITNCGDLGSSALRQSFLQSLQAMKSASPSLASGALLAKTNVLGAVQDLRRDAGSLQVAMTQLVNAMQRGEVNPPNRTDITQTLKRIQVEAEGASGLIHYAEQVAAQLQRLGG